MRALVTGASGFIGSHLTDALLDQGFSVRVLLRKKSSQQWLCDPRLEIFFGDLVRGDFAPEMFRDVDYLFHAAGAVEALSRREYFEVNEGGTRQILEEVRRSKAALKKFILISSQAAGGPSREGETVRENDPPRPVSAYGESKLASEKAALEFKSFFPLVILRPPTIYGPRDRRLLRAFQMVNSGYIFTPGKGTKRASLCYVADLVEAILRAAEKSHESGRIYNVAGHFSYAYEEIVLAISRALNRSCRIFYLPNPVMLGLGAMGEIYSRLTGKAALLSWERIKDLTQNHWILDGTRVRQELDWEEKTSLSEGLSETAAWYREKNWL